MAVKYYCDGCDDEMKYDHIKAVIGTEYSQTTYELCKTCFAKIYPKTWPRRIRSND